MNGDDDREPDTITLAGKGYARLRVGEESARVDSPCPGCAAYYFDLHRAGCDFEQCPRCGGQLASCECRAG